MICYLDTQVMVWVCEKQLDRLTAPARAAIEDSELRISPIVLLELEYLYEIKRILRPPQLLFDQLEIQLGMTLCDHPFPAVIRAAITETWTRDPFDRLVVAQARSNGYAPLITSDVKIRDNYPRTLW